MKHLHKIRTKGFKESTIISAWRKCGLVPFNPEIVLSQIKELKVKPQPRTPEETLLASSPLRRTPRTVPQFAQGSQFALKFIGKRADSMAKDRELTLS
jgi:hypothetical protein